MSWWLKTNLPGVFTAFRLCRGLSDDVSLFEGTGGENKSVQEAPSEFGFAPLPLCFDFAHQHDVEDLKRAQDEARFPFTKSEASVDSLEAPKPSGASLQPKKPDSGEDLWAMAPSAEEPTSQLKLALKAVACLLLVVVGFVLIVILVTRGASQLF